MSMLGERDKISIEHILPRKHFPNKRTDFHNMLVVCKNSHNHCDISKKANQFNAVHNKIRSNIEDLITYRADGSIYSSNYDVFKDVNDSKLLNLNIEFLKSRRKIILEEFEVNYVETHKRKRLIKESLESKIESLYQDSVAYKGVIIFKLKDHLKRMNN